MALKAVERVFVDVRLTFFENFPRQFSEKKVRNSPPTPRATFSWIATAAV
jgi:hypothetical protein